MGSIISQPVIVQHSHCCILFAKPCRSFCVLVVVLASVHYKILLRGVFVTAVGYPKFKTTTSTTWSVCRCFPRCRQVVDFVYTHILFCYSLAVQIVYYNILLIIRSREVGWDGVEHILLEENSVIYLCESN